jgi:dolichol-phosphate mannosyltransferase
MHLPFDLTVAIPALNEGPNLARLLPELRDVLDGLAIRYEVLIVTRDADEMTLNVAAASAARVIEQTKPGYGGALLAAFEHASSTYVLTMDADLSHPPIFIKDMWLQRKTAEVIIASRYIPGGHAEMPRFRLILSRTNTFFA